MSDTKITTLAELLSAEGYPMPDGSQVPRDHFYDDGAGRVGLKYGGDHRVVWWAFVQASGCYKITGSTDTPEGARRVKVRPDRVADALVEPQSDPGAEDPPPFPCPGCGRTDAWLAHYLVPESQGVTSLRLIDGQLDADDYDGCTKSYDAEGDEWYECSACFFRVNLDGTPHADNAEYVKTHQEENNP